MYFIAKTPTLLSLCLTILMMAFTPPALTQVIIKNYTGYTGIATNKHGRLIVLRKFERNNTTTYLAADPETLRTLLIDAGAYQISPSGWNVLQEEFKNTPYFKSLDAARSTERRMADAGITHGFQKTAGIILTVDLCPSHRNLDRSIFANLFSEFGKSRQPIPVALSITGSFIKKHIDDIRWLQEQERQGNIAITWINHTLHHHYDPRASLNTNFLLAPETNMQQEVLGNEIFMLENNLCPSVFFRFPGLISDAKTMDFLLNTGIIPVGSDAWLAKGQPIHKGSLVLIHGNGNEAIGIKDFLMLLKQEHTAIQSGIWRLYDLRDNIGKEFN